MGMNYLGTMPMDNYLKGKNYLGMSSMGNYSMGTSLKDMILTDNSLMTYQEA